IGRGSRGDPRTGDRDPPDGCVARELDRTPARSLVAGGDEAGADSPVDRATGADAFVRGAHDSVYGDRGRGPDREGNRLRNRWRGRATHRRAHGGMRVAAVFSTGVGERAYLL